MTHRDVTTGGAQGARAPPVFLELLRRNIPCTCIWPDLYYIVHPQILALCNIPACLKVHLIHFPSLLFNSPMQCYRGGGARGAGIAIAPQIFAH